MHHAYGHIFLGTLLLSWGTPGLGRISWVLCIVQGITPSFKLQTYFFVAIFLPAIGALRGPFLVRALVFVL